MGQQQITNFFYEFSFLLFPHHLFILKNDMKLIQVTPILKDLIVKILKWNKIIPLCQDLNGKVEFPDESTLISGTMPQA